MADEVLVDALPYIDQEYDDPNYREAALQLIEEETRVYRPNKSYIDYLPPISNQFESPLLKIEMERLAARQPMESLSMKRYELPQPGAAMKNDVSAWQDSVNNSCAQLEHQSTRILNLDLLAKYGAEEWKLHNVTLSKMVEKETEMLKGVRNDIQEVNWQRKTEQTAAGKELAELTQHWTTLIYKNFEIEKACMELERSIQLQKLNNSKKDNENV